MRVRTIMTVALLSAGCGTSGSARQAPASTTTAAAAPPAATAPPAAPTVMAMPAPVTAAAAPAPASRVQLEQLADELRATAPEQVAARAAHFRPLCDAEGYPLVGNLAMKSANPPKPVAEFCASVRGGAAR